MISFMCLAFSSASRIDLAPEVESLEAIDYQNRADYIESLNQVIECESAGVGRFRISVVQAAPTEAVKSLHVAMYASREDGTRVNPPEFVQEQGESGNIKLSAYYDLSELSSAFGCTDLPANDEYMGKICYFAMDYITTESMLTVSTVEYSLAVRIPKSGTVEYVISASKIYKKLCDCEINSDYELGVEAFTDEACSIPLNGETLIYGSLICLRVFTTDALASRFAFDTISVLTVYKDASGNDRTLEMIPVATLKNGVGQSEIVMDVLSIGDYISYTITVVLDGGLRMLEGNLRRLSEIKAGEGLQGSAPWFKVEQPKDSSSDGNASPSSSASSLMQSVFALLMIAGVLLL